MDALLARFPGTGQPGRPPPWRRGRATGATQAREHLAGGQGSTAQIAVGQPTIDQLGHPNGSHGVHPADRVDPLPP